MNRRHFVTAIGASTTVWRAIGAANAQSPGERVAARAQISLNGQWERWIAGKQIDTVDVPSSLRPSGYYRLKRFVTLPKLRPADRAFIRFQAIHYHGRVFVNGVELGTTAPYVPYEFEFTASAREGQNTVEVAIADLCPDAGGAGADEVWYGVNPGWEAYGGIVRDADIEIRPDAFIDAVRFGYGLARDYTEAKCRARVTVNTRTNGQAVVGVVLARGTQVLGKSERGVVLRAGSNEVELEFAVDDVALWSPEQPNLYHLQATLQSNREADRWTCNTGFREIAIEGSRFLLNGRPVLLNGVCRHDLWKGQGFTLTRRQMQDDMRAIKALGANYVRLVHYPHDRRIVELADELGLMVSEEPGFWGMDFRSMPPSRPALALRVIERMVRRDWNSPSVFAWLLGNECQFTVDYLQRAKKLCRDLDPLTRPVSIANSMKKEEAKPICEQSGMDFFDDHPYTFDVVEFEEIAKFYGPEKPLLFTEWGGREIGQSEIIMARTVDKLLELSDQGRLAGHAFWSWQDLPEFSRIDAEMRDGILESGVVTEGREPRQLTWAQLSRLFEGRREAELPAAESPSVVALRRAPWGARSAFQQIDLQGPVSSAETARAWTDFETRIAKHWEKTRPNQWDRTGRKFRLWKTPEVDLLGVRFAMPIVDGYVRPLVVTPEFPTAEVKVGQTCARLHFLGNVTFPGGHPLAGDFGKTIGSYVIHYSGGHTQQVPLRNGIEVAAGNAVHSATRIDPVATAAQRALWFVKDPAREQYQALLFSVGVESAPIESVAVRLASDGAPLLLFSIVAELA